MYHKHATTICINLPSQVFIVPEQTAARKNNNNLKGRQKFRLKKMQVQTVVQSLEFFFLANLSSRGVAVNKKRAKVQPRFRSFLQALSSEKNRQKQLKLEETDNAIIKSILSSLWQNFFYSYLKWSLTRKLTNFSVRFSTVALSQEKAIMAIF